MSSQSSMMIGKCAVGSMGGAIFGRGSCLMETSSVGMSCVEDEDGTVEEGQPECHDDGVTGDV